MKKIVLTSPSSFGQCGSEPFDLLTKHGFDVINNPFGRRLSEEEVIELARDCVGIVAGVEPLTARVIDALPNLKCISRVGVGIDNVDIAYTKTKGIAVVNTPDGPTLPVAELTLAMTMALLRRIPQAHHNLKNGRWKKEIGNLLYGKTVGVIGLGRIGRKVAAIFRTLGNLVIGYDLVPDEDWANQNSVTISSMEKVLKEADIITLHIPENPDKSPVLSKSEFAMMRSSAILINTARGGVVDEEALYEFLKNNQIGGAALDVYSKEPYDGCLIELDNIVFTPHLGSYAAEAKLQMEINAVKNLIDEMEKS